MILSYGQWIDIISRGTSGDQVADILSSWKEDAYRHLENIHKLEYEKEILREALKEIVSECPEPKSPYGKRIVEIAKEVLK
ncbi:MAG: hypothetical protein WBK67_00105 [Minisyncoccales bacterium]